MNAKRFLLISAVLALVAFTLSAKGPAVKKMSAYGYIVRSGGATLIVDMDLARYRGSEKYIPLGIWLGYNNSSSFKIDRSSFTLTDPSGKVHTLATTKEVTKGYGSTLVSADYSYYRRIHDYGSMAYLSYRYIPGVAFFPNPSGRPGILYDHVELPMRTFFRSIVYFENPAGKVKGTYTLKVMDTKGKVKMSVPFEITWSSK